MKGSPNDCYNSIHAEQLQLTEKLRLCELGKCPTCGNKYKDASKEELIKKQGENDQKLIDVNVVIQSDLDIGDRKSVV